MLADFSGEVTVRGIKPIVIEGVLSGKVDAYDFEDADVVLSVDGHLLTLARAEGHILGTPARMSGSIDTRLGRLKLRGHVEDLDLSLPWARRDLGWPESSLAGRVELEVGLRSPVTVDLRAEEVQGRVLDLPVDSLTVGVHFEDGVGARFTGLRLLTHGTWLEGEGTVDSLGVLDLPFTATALDLASWDDFYDLPFESAEGLVATGRFLGPTAGPALSVEGRLESLRGFRLEAREFEGSFRLPLWNRIEDVEGSFEAKDLLVSDRRLGELAGAFDRRSPLTHVPYLQVTRGDTTFSSSGRILERGTL